jgi:hypothetical protein
MLGCGMALPPKDMHTRCLRCGRGLETDVVRCPSCGANREVEMAVAYELNPTIAQLKAWLLVLGALSAALGVFMYVSLRGIQSNHVALMVMLPNLVMGGMLVGMALIARRYPLAVSLASLVLLALTWLANLATDPASALMPGLGNAMRLMFLLVVIGAVRSGFKASRIRDGAPRQ